jgi:hypothetical protein
LIRTLLKQDKIMDTLEQRVERLERSCRRWQLGFLIMLAVGGACAATTPGSPPPLADAQFGHLTVQSLTIRTQPDGAFISASCDKDRAAIKLASPSAGTLATVLADKDTANVIISQSTPKGLASAALSTDAQSGFVDVRSADGKDKEFEPE